MELLPMLRLLWQRRILIAIGAVVSIAIGVVAAGGETSKRGTASARLVLDTAKSQLIYPDPSGADTLTWRAVLLADLAASKPLTDSIAKEVGIRTDELVVVHPELTDPVMPTTLPTRAAEVARVTPEEYILTVRFDELLPIISVAAAAPDRRAAVRLVDAATGALKDTGTPERVTPEIQGLVVESAGPVRSKEKVEKLQPLLGVVIAVVLFGLWCATVALIPRLLSAWHAAGSPRPA